MPPPDMRRCSLIELDDNQCRWPLGDVHRVATMFCGGAVEPGRAYCGHHWRMACGIRERTIPAGGYMKSTTADRPYSDPEKAARMIVEIANSVEAGQEGRIYIELINGPFLFREKGTPEEYKAGLDLAIERGWLELDRSGTFVRFTQAGSDLFA